MKFTTVYEWNDLLWKEAEKIYVEAFPAHSRKKTAIIKKMFEKKICFLHIAYESGKMVAMALSGRVDRPDMLILDYIAVRKDIQNHGIGRQLLEYIKDWGLINEHFTYIVVEVEAEKTNLNQRRIQFWQKRGFQITDYVHTYIWVPEKYIAMYCSLTSTSAPVMDGKLLFSYITEFHKKSYRS